MDRQAKMTKTPGDTRSKRSRGYRSASHKSREEDIEAMSLEEVECLLERAQKELEVQRDLRRRLVNHKLMSNKVKKKKIKPIDD